MKKNSLSIALLGFSLCLSTINLDAQTTADKLTVGPYTLRNSDPFETPKGHTIKDPMTFPDGVLQISAQDLESFHLQWFSNDLKLMKENTVAIRNKFNKDVRFWGFLKLKTKVYAFTREVFHDKEAEGLTVLEIDPKALDIKGNSKNLFTSSGKVRMENVVMTSYGLGLSSDAGLAYDVYVSDDRSKFMCSYALASRERNDKLNKDIIGIQVYDENLVNLWGAELEMPYTEAKMDNLGYTLTNDGKVCLLAKVYEGESKRDGARNKEKPNYHFEVLIYQKGSKTPKIIEIKLDNYFNRESYIYQDKAGNIAVAGFYGQKAGSSVDGAYLLTLDIEKAIISKVNGGFYEIPLDFIKSFLSERQKRKVEKKEEKDDDFDLELRDLVIRSIYSTPDGSTKIVAEIFKVIEHTTTHNGQTTTRYTYAYNDVVIMNVKGGKLDWIKKIRKNTETGSSALELLSINSMVTGNDLHIFWKDKPENSNVPEGEKLAKFGGKDGMLRACKISANGQMENFDIVDLEKYEMRFSIRRFSDNRNNTLINTERSRKVNLMFALDVKP